MGLAGFSSQNLIRLKSRCLLGWDLSGGSGEEPVSKFIWVGRIPSFGAVDLRTWFPIGCGLQAAVSRAAGKASHGPLLFKASVVLSFSCLESL